MTTLLEPVTSLCAGAMALAFGENSAVLPSISAAAGVSAHVLGQRDEMSGEASRILAKLHAEQSQAMQAADLSEDHRAAIETVDAILLEDIPKLKLDRTQLARFAREGDLPGGATELILDTLNLAAHPPVAITYARRIIRAGFDAAMEREPFYRGLQVHLSLDQARAIGLIGADVAAILNLLSTMQAQIADLRSAGLPPALLENLALRFGAENPDATPAAHEAFLKEKAKEFREMQTRLDAMAAADGRMANLIGAAEAALARGAFDEADARLADAEEMQQAEHTLAQVRKQAGLREERASAALLKGDVARAADHFETAAGFLTPFDADEGAGRLRAGALRVQAHGERVPGPGLSRAEAIHRRLLTVWTREGNAGRWAMTQNDLGIALRNQGQRTGGAQGADLLAQAVAAYHAALEVYTRADAPAHWATIQNNLGSALDDQGQRTGGAQGADLLAQAVAAYRAALEVFTRTDAPADWAMTQNNLGIALRNQGLRTGGAQGADLLAQAVAAFRAALEVRTRADAPADWAMTQNNLGLALADQGQRTGGAQGADLLAQAVAAHRAALEVRTREDAPADWAMTQNNLGIALLNQGQRTGGAQGADLLAQAVAAYRAALEVRTREDAQADWAMTQENIAEAFEALGDLGGERAAAHFAAALAAVDGALEVYDPEAMSYDFETATRLRARVAEKLARPGG